MGRPTSCWGLAPGARPGSVPDHRPEQGKEQRPGPGGRGEHVRGDPLGPENERVLGGSVFLLAAPLEDLLHLLQRPRQLAASRSPHRVDGYVGADLPVVALQIHLQLVPALQRPAATAGGHPPRPRSTPPVPWTAHGHVTRRWT